MPLDVAGTGTILLVGGGETAQGEVWLENNTGGEVKIEDVHLTVTVGGADQTGRIPLPADEVIANQSFRRLSISFGMEPFTAPGEYAARVDLDTSVGAQSIPAVLVVVANAQLAVLCEQPVFTKVVPPTTLATAVIVRNLGNVAVDVDAIVDEPLFEVAAGQRLIGVGAGGVVQVQPDVQLGRDRAHAHLHASRPHRRSNRPRGRRSASTSAFLRRWTSACTFARSRGSRTIVSASTS